MRNASIALVTMLVAACAGEPATAPERSAPQSAAPIADAVTAGSWVRKAQYPLDVFAAASAAITGSGRTTAFVIGGVPRCCGAGLISDQVRAYDVAANTWSRRAHYPVRIESTNGAVEIDGRIYVSGGFTRRFDEAAQVYRRQSVKSLYVYTPGTDAWVRKRDLPTETVGGASAGFGGRLYVAANCFIFADCQVPAATIWRYNPGTNQWSTLATSTERDYSGAAGGIINGKFYIVEQLGAMEVYDIATGTRTSGPKRPFRRCVTSATTWQAKLYLFGSCDSVGDPTLVERGFVFDPATNAWSQVTPAPVPAGQGTLARVFVGGNPRLQLVGGTRPDNHYLFVP